MSRRAGSHWSCKQIGNVVRASPKIEDDNDGNDDDGTTTTTTKTKLQRSGKENPGDVQIQAIITLQKPRLIVGCEGSASNLRKHKKHMRKDNIMWAISLPRTLLSSQKGAYDWPGLLVSSCSSVDFELFL